jgi:hypothetical protein
MKAAANVIGQINKLTTYLVPIEIESRLGQNLGPHMISFVVVEEPIVPRVTVSGISVSLRSTLLPVGRFRGG